MKIFICASKHNYKHIPGIQASLEKNGHIITLPNSFDDPFWETRTKAESKEKHIVLKQKLLKEQVEKIEKNDAILVINFDKLDSKNYIGGATFLEIYKAFELGRPIFLYNPIPQGILEDEIIGMNPTIINGDLNLVNAQNSSSDVKEIIYNKLIRDKIPEITAADGWISQTRTLKKKEFIESLKAKILEEAQELNEGEGKANLIEELVDIQEVIDAILEQEKIKFTDFRKKQLEKRKKRGGFQKKLFLLKTNKEVK